MPLVSILIPAFKPEFLAKTIFSAREQTLRDIEILVGDDTADGRLRSLVDSIDDPRIRYFHHGFQNTTANSQALWDVASAPYIKWLYDDDFLLPESVEILLLALRQHPESAMAFHERVLIDEQDRVSLVPPPLTKPGTVVLVDRQALVRTMAPKINNMIGEPSNIMLNRARIKQPDVLRHHRYNGYDPFFLNDLFMYLNLASQAPIVLVGGYLSAFRRHAAQASNLDSPISGACYFEWEILVRGEAAAGILQSSEIAIAKENLNTHYRSFAPFLPELQPFLDSLDELTSLPPDELPNTPAFRQNVANARAVILKKIQLARAKHRESCQQQAAPEPERQSGGEMR